MAKRSSAQQVAPMSPLAWGLLLSLGFIWGGSFFFGKIAVTTTTPLTLVLLRVGIAAFCLHFYLFLRGRKFSVTAKQMGQFLILGMLNNIIPFGLIFLGQTEIGAGLAAIINATTPFWTVMIASGLTKQEAPSLKTMLGILCGIIGVAVLIGPELIFDNGGPLWPKIAIFGATISYGFAAVFAKHVTLGTPENIATGQLTASTVWMIPIILIVEGVPDLSGQSVNFWASVILLATICTAFAYILYFQILAMAGATNTSLVTLIVPASAILLGVVFLNETLKVQEYLGMAIIALGLIVIDGRLFARYKKP